MLGWLRSLFSDGDKWAEMDRALTDSFEKVKAERKLIFSWINHLRRRDMDTTHSFEKIQFTMGEHEATLHQLQAEMTLIKQFLLSQRAEGTSQGQVRDKSRDKSETQKMLEKPKEVVNVNTEGLRGAELEVLKLLYYSDRPMGYEELSSRLSKSEKSVRNIVYELRKRGIDIKAKPIGAREKGFFIEKEVKIELSGR